STGEDGDFEAKVARTEDVDAAIPRITALKPDVLIVTGDHSTPAKMRSHSWHPVPTLLAAENCRFDRSESFGEAECARGGLGQFEAKHLMLLALAHAGRLEKLGARRIARVKRWVVMEAPTGQRFCVVTPQRANFEATANRWQ
ncbi:MAG: hypothetical protein IID41_17255, partial [Planctomycetes bacterium]|nr:hypothetical protein [Planctomycetota bacterium]